MGKVKKEGLVGILLLFKKIHGIIGQFIGDVSLLLHALTIHVQCVVRPGRHVMALSSKTDPIIKPGTRGIRLTAHVPLSDKSGLIACLLKPFGKELGPIRHQTVVVNHTMLVRVETGQDRCTAWRTQRCCDESVFQMNAISCNRIHMGRFQKGMPHETHRVITMIVG